MSAPVTPSIPPLPLSPFPRVSPEDARDLRASYEADGYITPAGTRIGPHSIYRPTFGDGEVAYPGSRRPGTVGEDWLALQLTVWAELSDAMGQQPEESFALPDRACAYRCFVVARGLDACGRWRISVAHLQDAETRREVELSSCYLPCDADILASLDTFGADVSELEDALEHHRSVDHTAVIDVRPTRYDHPCYADAA